jgi:hypothetical protein
MLDFEDPPAEPDSLDLADMEECEMEEAAPGVEENGGHELVGRAKKLAKLNVSVLTLFIQHRGCVMALLPLWIAFLLRFFQNLRSAAPPPRRGSVPKLSARVPKGVSGSAKKNELAYRLDRAIATDEETLAVTYRELNTVFSKTRACDTQKELILDAFGLSSDGLVGLEGEDGRIMDLMCSGEVEAHALELDKEVLLAPEEFLSFEREAYLDIPAEQMKSMTGDSELKDDSTRKRYQAEFMRFGVRPTRVMLVRCACC